MFNDYSNNFSAKYGNYLKSQLNRDKLTQELLFKYFVDHCSHKLKCHVWNVTWIVNIVDDEKSTPYPYCSVQQNINCINILIKVTNLCRNLCPIDCINDFYSAKYGDTSKTFSHNLSKTSVMFDQYSPLITYIETETLSFINLFVYMGGLYGIWFGVSILSFRDLFKKSTYFQITSLFKQIIAIIITIIVKIFTLILRMCDMWSGFVFIEFRKHYR